MTNKLISSTIRALRKTPFLVSLLFFLFTGLTANSQTYEFETHLRSEKSTSLHIYKLIIDQSSGTVKVTYELFIPSFLDSIEDVDLDSTKIREIGINENSEIVIVDSNNEAVVGVYVNNTGTNGYFIYKSKEYGELLTVQLSEPEKYLSTFKKLKQAVESGAFDKKSSTKTSSNTSKANSTTAKTNSASSKTNSTSVSTKTPAQTATVKKEDNTPYTATVTNPRYYLRKPGQNVSEWLINYDVVNSRQMDRWNYLYVQNADTKQWLNSKKTGKKWFRSSANGNSMLTFSLSADDLPPATETKPVRLKMWIYMATPSTEGWIGSFATPVFIWDGKYMRQETSDQTTTVKNEDNTLYTAKVNNPRYQLRKPGQNVGYEWLINCNVTTSPQMDCGVYLYVQNADTKQWYKNRKTGNDWFKYYFNDNRMLTFELTDDELPPATKEKPVRLKMWIFMSTYYVDGWTGSFETPVFIWDGKYMRQE